MLTEYEIVKLKWMLTDADIRASETVTVPVDVLRKLVELWEPEDEG
jgi:hypothetical protein